MPHPRVTTDPADPDFPHGQERGFRRGCTCKRCDDAMYKARTRRHYLSEHGVSVRMDAAPVREHLLGLIEALGGTCTNKAITRATGVSNVTVADVRAAKYKTIGRPAGQALLAATPASVAAHTTLIPSAEPMRTVRGLMALGYSGEWISEQIGHKPRRGAPHFMYRHWEYMTRDLAERIERLAREVGNTPGPSKRTAENARARGWYPLAAYDDAGNLDLRLLPGHPWERADARAGRVLDAVLATLAPDVDPRDAAMIYGLPPDSVYSVMRRMEKRYGAGLRETLRDARAAVEGGTDATLVALRLGVVGTTGSDRVPTDHPAVLVWKDERVRVAPAS